MNPTLNLIDFAALSPLLIVLFGALGLLILETVDDRTSRKYAFYVTLITLAIALYAALVRPVSTNALLTPWIHFDALARFFTILFLVIGFCCTLLSSPFFKRFDVTRGEYYFLLLSSVFGLILIGASADFLTLFIGLETLSISLYVWCGYIKKWESSSESSIKYFLIGSMATAFLLYGIALIYGAVGSTQFEGLLSSYRSLEAGTNHTLFLTGIALVTLGLAFKAAIVPFHVWAPDVYDGAPTPVTAFMAVGTKAGAFAALIRVFMQALPQFDPLWNEGIAWLAYPTLIYANIVALRQHQLRRFFAYSGISHAGFMLIPFAASTPDALSSLLFYLVIYSIATLGCFSVLAFLDKRKEGVMLNDLQGLFYRSPLLAGVLSLCLLTLAGVPPTAGFFAKFYVFRVAFEAGYYGLVITGLLTTVLAVFYYLRIVALMISHVPQEEIKPLHSWSAALVGLVSIAAIIALSFYPAPLMNLLAVASK